ncbi:hypothetical protein ACFWUZ_24000 [Streptomyces sp. NPDC058646]|uniref:hypothetical protein n=1 Tax=Streptomyces sp. NPDC058646 TaxID=3346574 RepID=UPI003652B5B1
MQLRRTVPLSFLALLACAGCVTVGPDAPGAVPGAVPPVGVAGVPPPLPLGELPEPPSVPEGDAAGEPAGDVGPGTDPGRPDPAPSRSPAKADRPSSGRAEKPKTPPRRVRSPKPKASHPHRHPPLPSRMGELCAAAEGTVPPPLVDLCLRQYGR